jgi:predicted Zn-dependent protease
MEKLLRTCIELAAKQGYAAQGFAHHSLSTGCTFKTLTGETLTQNTLEKNISFTIEKDGKKASRKFSYDSGLKAEEIVESAELLLGFVTADPAESLPDISDAFESDISKFRADELPEWAKKQYGAVKISLEEAIKTSEFEIGIESLIVSGSWDRSVFMNSFGAKKISASTYASFQIGFSGDNDGIADAEWLYRDSDSLFAYDDAWTRICLRKIEDKIQPVTAKFETGIHTVAMSPELSGECVGEILGFLSGYAIVEHMSPFSKAEIGAKILPEWISVQSFHALPGASSAQFFDGNGITTRDISPIQNGELRELFLSKASAERLGLVPNGQPGPVNVRISGTPPVTDLRGVKFLFTTLAGMHTIDSATGNFALEGEGYEVTEDGAVGKFVKNIGLSGNLRTLFGGLVGHLGDTPDYGSVRIPTLIFSAAQVTPTVA